MTIEDLEWLRAFWDGPLIIKGIQTVEDARRVADADVDAIVLSNHGGRQLDRAPVPLRLLPEVVEAVGDRTEVWLDTGIMSGADIIAAVALGAKAALVGRAYLYGLMAGGERGVERAAEILTREIRRTMQLLGGAEHPRAWSSTRQSTLTSREKNCERCAVPFSLGLPGSRQEEAHPWRRPPSPPWPRRVRALSRTPS